MCKFSEYTKQKLGNTIVYMARNKSNLSISETGMINLERARK